MARIALAAVLVIGVIVNLLVVSQPRWEAFLLYWGSAAAVMLLFHLFLQPTAPFIGREAAILVFCATLCLPAIAITSGEPAPQPLQPFVFAALSVNFMIVFMRLPFLAAAMLEIAAACACAAALLTNLDVAEPQKMSSSVFLLALALPTLMAAHWLERATRRLYLHGLVQRLNFERVVADNAVSTDLSYSDPLTGVANRRRLDGELQRLCDREDACASFLMVDVDWFKDFNDRYGHLAGDRFLQEVATCLAAALRDGDLLARLGGEEFGILLPTLPMQEAVLVAERLRAAVAAYPFMVGTRIVSLTVSVGVASIVGFDEPARVIDAADKAMYRAKRAGRNRVGGPWMKLAS